MYAPAIPRKAIHARAANPSAKFSVASRITPNRTGAITDPTLLSVLNTPKVVPATETP